LGAAAATGDRGAGGESGGGGRAVPGDADILLVIAAIVGVLSLMRVVNMIFGASGHEYFV